MGSSAKPMATSSERCWEKMRALAASYVAIEACQLRWSGARLSHAAASPRNCSVHASRKLAHSTTKASTSRSTASTSGTSVLPAATERTPPAASISTAHSVVVVLPSVPVTASIGRGPPGRSCSQR